MAKEPEKTEEVETTETEEPEKTEEVETTETEELDKSIWQIECLMCDTSAKIPAQKIIGRKKASFIVVPRIICGKCKSVCTAKLIEEGNVVYG